MLTERTPRVVAARKLLRRVSRERAGRFLVEGAQAVSEAIRYGRVHEIFATQAALDRNAALLDGVPVTLVDDRAADGLSDTVTPQGLIAVCDLVDVPLAEAVRGARLVAVLAGIAEPGNAGTVLRAADAAGADAVVFAGDTVDPHNPKAVRASTGSLFHLPVARERDPATVLDALAGLTLLAADGHGEVDLHASPEVLAGPTAWIFGGEAHGVPETLLARADHRVRVPLYGRAESLNLATAAAVCLYASAHALRSPTVHEGTR
ncbi:TrmH family RNA methyltransferase [Pseudonocardia sp. WMMC193]|uniref:TrmH family RNA methyltransferase n=1 Tax=Pseudonocardia sp. WMMC193 TaxID=2911965 RepID=UPI0035ABE4C7